MKINSKVVKWNPCCDGWYKSVNAIEVRATMFDDPQEKMRAEDLTKLMQYMLGQYCPTCGNHLEFYKIRELK